MDKNLNNNKIDTKTSSFNFFPKLVECKCTADYKKFMKTEPVTLQFREKSNQQQRSKHISLLFSDIEVCVNEIERLEDTTYSPQLTIFLPKTNYTFIFKTLTDKYLVKSLIYSTLLTSISREYIDKQLELRVSVITWNLSEIHCPDGLEKLLENTPPDKIDILAIGVQECSMTQYYKWMQTLKTKIGQFDFVEVESESLFQMFLIVFIKKDLKCLISRVEKSTRAMGFANVIGNKGGIIISFYVMGFHFAFLNCHLAPKMFKVLERNKMAKNLVDAFKVGDKIADFDVLADYTFWFGDMNYRVDCSYDETVNELVKNNLKILITKDQLTKHRKNNEIFCHFVEPEITFLPTYRRNKASKTYLDDEDTHRQCEKEQLNNLVANSTDANNNSTTTTLTNTTLISNTQPPVTKILSETLTNSHQNNIYRQMYSNKDNQSPSWCDRILLKSQRKVNFLFYSSLEGMRYSDHLPVVGYYSLYLSVPLLENLSQPSDDKIKGDLLYKNIVLRFNQISLKEIVELKDNYSFKLQAYYFIQDLQDKKVVSSINILTKEKDWLDISFSSLPLQLPPNMIFDYPQIQAFNIFFVITVKTSKSEVDIGFAKYSFEGLEQSNNMMHHLQKLDVYYQLTHLGILSFEASYFCDSK